MMKKTKLKKGLTLVELIVYIGIVAIVLVSLISLTTNLVYSQGKSVKSNEIGQNLNLAYERLSDSIQNASSATVNANEIVLTIDGGTVTYNLSGNALQIIENANPPVPLTNDQVVVSPPSGEDSFREITNGNAKSIQIKLIFSQTSNVNNKETLLSTILMRGK